MEQTALIPGLVRDRKGVVMDDDEYTGFKEELPETAVDQPPREPGPQQPERFHFDDWALI